MAVLCARGAPTCLVLYALFSRQIKKFVLMQALLHSMRSSLYYPGTSPLSAGPVPPEHATQSPRSRPGLPSGEKEHIIYIHTWKEFQGISRRWVVTPYYPGTRDSYPI